MISIPEETSNCTKLLGPNYSINDFNTLKINDSLSPKFTPSVVSSLESKQLQPSVKVIKKFLSKCDQSFT